MNHPEREQRLIDSIYQALGGSERGMATLGPLQDEDWELLEEELGGIIYLGSELGTHERVRRMAKILQMAMGGCARQLLKSCLKEGDSSTRKSASDILKEMGESAAWAEPLLLAVAEDESMPLHTRNSAAEAAATVAGRPAPEPIEPEALPLIPDALDEALEHFDWHLDEPSVVACANGLGAAAKPILAKHFNKWRSEEVRASRIGYLASEIEVLQELVLEALRSSDEEDWPYLCEIIEEGFFGEPELEPQLEELLSHASSEEGRRTMARALAHVTGEHMAEWLLRKDDETRKIGRERLAKLRPEHIARQGAALVHGIKIEVDVWGWETTDLIVEALARAPEDALVAELVRFARGEPADDGYWRVPLRGRRLAPEILKALAQRHQWARRVHEVLEEERRAEAVVERRASIEHMTTSRFDEETGERCAALVADVDDLEVLGKVFGLAMMASDAEALLEQVAVRIQK